MYKRYTWLQMIIYCFHNNNPIHFTIIKNLQIIDLKFAFRSMIDHSGFDRSDRSFSRIVWPLMSNATRLGGTIRRYLRSPRLALAHGIAAPGFMPHAPAQSPPPTPPLQLLSLFFRVNPRHKFTFFLPRPAHLTHDPAIFFLKIVFILRPKTHTWE